MDERLLAAIESGYAQGQALNAFNRLTVRKTRHVETFCGLMVGQKIAFTAARAARQKLLRHLDAQRQLLSSMISAALLAPRPDLVGVVVEYVGDLEFAMAISPEKWRAWGSASHVVERIPRLLLVWRQRGMPAMLATQGEGIGPWTRKAFGLMCLGETHLLHEDAWIAKRWRQLCKLRLNPVPDLKLVPEKIDHKQLSFMLWRITSAGVVKLANNKPLDKRSFI